jgi:hypothetical protein
MTYIYSERWCVSLSLHLPCEMYFLYTPSQLTRLRDNQVRHFPGRSGANTRVVAMLLVAQCRAVGELGEVAGTVLR